MQTWHVGGVAVFCQRLASGLSHLGFSPYLILATPFGKRDEPGRRAYERLIGTAPFPVLCLHLSAYHPKERGWRAADQIAELNCAAFFLSGHQSIFGGLTALAPQTALIGIAHNDDQDSYREFELTESYCTAYVGVSSVITQTLESLRGPSHDLRVRQIPYGVPAAPEFDGSVPSGPARILTVSRLVQHQKRVLDLPPIWRQYRQKGGQGTLTIAGPGQEEARLRELFAEEIRREEVRVLSAVPLEQMPELYAQHDLFLSVSTYEGLPQAVLEAVSAGLYPVLSRIRSGHTEIVDCLNEGRLCEVGDPSGFASALLEIGASVEKARKLRPLLRQRARARFNLETMVQAYAALAAEVAPRAPNGKQPAWLNLPRPRVDFVRRFLRHWQYSRHYGWELAPAPPKADQSFKS